MKRSTRATGPSTNPPGPLKAVWDVALDSWRGYHFGKSMSPGESPAKTLPPGPLEQYFDAHKTGPGLWKWRHYFPIYERHLAKFRDREVHMVEIGVLKGGSLDMWTWYLGDRSHIYGVDVSEECLAYEGHRKRVFIGDQSDPEFWKRFLREVPSFDIVLDDGGHRSFQQRPTFEALIPHLNPGGVYLCEDIHHASNSFTDYVFEFSRNLHTLKPGGSVVVDNEPTNFQRVIDSVHLYPYLAVVEKREGRLDSLIAPKHGTDW
jgi:Methyltransferase domain